MDLSTISNAIGSFFIDEIYLRLFFVTLALFIVVLFTWFMYTRLSKRDLFGIKALKGDIKWHDRVFYILKYTFFFPLLTFVWFLLFVVCLRLVTKRFSIEEIMFLGIVLVSAIRMAAYVSEKMAEDLAKLLPLALLVLIVIDPTQIEFASLSELMFLEENAITLSKYLFFTISLEWVLRIYYSVHSRVGEKTKKG